MEVNIRIGLCSTPTEYYECNEVECVFQWPMIELYIIQAIMQKKKKKINAQSNARQITLAIHWWTTQANIFSFDSVSNKL